jgi:3-deoxy-D-manno-octulosonate cytidylyltransferase
MKVIAVIPARFASTRFPGKPLALLAGKPMILHVLEAVQKTALFNDVLVATDDERIFQVVQNAGGKAVLTSSNHQSGSDRIAEVVKNLDVDIIFNVQGDEPFISGQALKDLRQTFEDESVQVASLMHEISDLSDICNPNMVKVVCAQNGDALYFSRSAIPFDRDAKTDFSFWKHVGVYAYRKSALLQFVSLPQGTLEKVESLEQLRLLENGIAIRMIPTTYTGMGIDTPADLQKAELLFS